jgi:hypothetical protein
MTTYVNPVKMSPASQSDLRRDGYLKIASLFTPASIEGFRMMLGAQLRDQGEDRAARDLTKHTGGGEFARYSNNVDLRGELMAKVRDSEEFRGFCAGVDEGKWLLTQGLGFEINPGQKGLAWHFGFRSFSFIRPEDQGYTLWIPLDDIDPAGQNGGLPVVSESTYSGREEAKLLARVCHDRGDDDLVKAVVGHFPGFYSLRNAVLDRHPVEYAFSPGDALLFNRYVFHRSAPFLEGQLRTRRAFVMRLIGADARFDPDLLEASTALFARLGMHTHEDPVGLRLTDLRAGDPLGRSQFIPRLY